MNEGLNLFSDEQLFDEIKKRKEKNKRKASECKINYWKREKESLLSSIESLDSKIKEAIPMKNCDNCDGKEVVFIGNTGGDPHFRTGDNGVEKCSICNGKGFMDNDTLNK